MADDTVTTYGLGGYNPGDPDGNVLSVEVVPVPPEEENRRTVHQQAASALQGNRDFLAIDAPTNAKVLAQVRALTRQNQALIRLALGLLDGTD